MIVVFDSYAGGQAIPVQEYLRNKKLAKYFNREAAAAVICAAKLLKQSPLKSDAPFYYETGRMEFEDYGLDRIVAASIDGQGRFSQQLFVEKGTKAVMPLTQFKALYNMPLSLVSIEHNLSGDNAVIYASARGLLMQALHSPVDTGILLGCGKVYADGTVESAFALVDKNELGRSPFLSSDQEAIGMFRAWHAAGAGV